MPLGRTLAALALVLSATPGTQAAEASVDELLHQGDEFLRIGHLDLAQRAYEQAYERDPSPRTALALARAYELAGLAPEAIRLYQWLADGPEGPDTHAGLEGLRRLRPQLAKGQLVLTVTPDGAEIALNGEAKGTAPLDLLELSPGAYHITAKKEGFRAAAQSFEIQPARVTGVFLALEPLAREAPRDPLAPWPWAMLATGGGLLVIGTVTYAVGDSQGEARDGPRKVAGAVLWAGAGAALCATAALFIALEHRPPVWVHPEATPGGVSLGLGGTF